MQTKSEILKYLKEHGYCPIRCNKFLAHGATQCDYYTVILKNGTKLFIKTGENVNYEIDNLNYLAKFNINSLPVALSGSDSSKLILITKWLSSPQFGYDIINLFHQGKVSAREMLAFQKKSFALLHPLYILQHEKRKLPYPQNPRERITFALKGFNVKTINIELANNVRIPLNKIVTLPINTQGGVNAISIADMCKSINNIFNKIKPLSSQRITHGDFHPPNIVGGGSGFLNLVDYADVAYRDNPCWDLGKWLNYIKRFYLVANMRFAKHGGKEMMARVNAKSIFLYSITLKKAISTTVIEKQAEKLFSFMTGLDEQQIKLESALCQFLVNVYTLKRHAILYPYTTKKILYFIKESYDDVRTLINKEHA